MPSGGYLIFEQTEAMYVVDVNSGRYAAKKAQEDNSLRTNLEAAREIAKQLRLRDIGGIIVVDFIDLQDDGNRKKVYDELKKEFRKDRAKTNLLPMSDFGLVQITRQRIRPSVVKSVSLVCPMCGGSGSIVSQNTVLSDIETWLNKYANNYKKRSVELNVNPYFHSLLTRGLFSQRIKWMFKYRMSITILGDETVSLNEYKMYLTGTEVDITQTVQEGQSIDEAIQEAERRLAELESGGQRDDSLLDYGSDEGENGKKGSGRGAQADRQTDRQDKRQTGRQQDSRSDRRQSAPSDTREADSRESSGRDKGDDRRGQQRQDTRRSNVKSKYYKSRSDEDESGDDTDRDSSGSGDNRSSTRGRTPAAAADEAEQAPDNVRTDSSGEPLRNAEDVAREYREKRMREEALKKQGQQQSDKAVETEAGGSGDPSSTDSEGSDTAASATGDVGKPGTASRSSTMTGTEPGSETATGSGAMPAEGSIAAEKPKPKRGGSRKAKTASDTDTDIETGAQTKPEQGSDTDTDKDSESGKAKAASGGRKTAPKKAVPKRTSARKTTKAKAGAEAETGAAGDDTSPEPAESAPAEDGKG
jgi:hypothetical protein